MKDKLKQRVEEIFKQRIKEMYYTGPGKLVVIAVYPEEDLDNLLKDVQRVEGFVKNNKEFEFEYCIVKSCISGDFDLIASKYTTHNRDHLIRVDFKLKGTSKEVNQ